MPIPPATHGVTLTMPPVSWAVGTWVMLNQNAAKVSKHPQCLNLSPLWAAISSQGMAQVQDQGHILTNVALGSLLFLGHGCHSSGVVTVTWYSNALLSTHTHPMPPAAILWGKHDATACQISHAPFSIKEGWPVCPSNAWTTVSQQPFWECASWGTFK